MGVEGKGGEEEEKRERKGRGGERRGREVGEGREGEVKGFARPMSNCFLGSCPPS